MKIGLVIESLDPRRGGVEQWTYQFARHVVTAGHELHVIAQQFAPAALALGIVAHRVEAGASRCAFAAAAERQARALRLDVVHDTGCGWHCDVFQPHGGSRTASFEQNLLLTPSWLRSLKRRAAAWLPRYAEFRELTERQYYTQDRIYLAISQMVADDLQRYHDVRAEQLRLVYNGVDLTRFSPAHREQHRTVVRALLGVDESEVLLLIVAHNFRLKGVPTLLRAAGRLQRAGQPVRVVVAGGKRTRAYEALAKRLGVGSAVTFLGAVDDPTPYYAAADVYVQPTFYDPCSLVVLEALASGLPVVTTRFNGAGELLTAGREGYVIHDPADDAELAAALTPLMDTARRSAMGHAARQLAEAHSLERNCREVLAVYQEAATTQRRAA